MDRTPISGLEVFLAVADQGSLRRAAVALGLQPPSVSYQLKQLEARLGTPLFIRTTRSVALTDAGRALLARARPAMAELGQAVEAARRSGAARKGKLRITLPFVAYQLTFGPALAEFREACPDIEIELSFNEAFENLAAEGFHAGVRLGEHLHRDMVAVRLTPPLKEVVFGSPAYFERSGRPRTPSDLLGHDCIRYRYIASGQMAEWRLKGPEGVTAVGVGGGLVVNSTTALIDAAERGLGLAWLFRPNVAEALEAGRLESVLDDYTIERPGYYLYYPRTTGSIEALNALVKFMIKRRRWRRSCEALRKSGGAQGVSRGASALRPAQAGRGPSGRPGG